MNISVQPRVLLALDFESADTAMNLVNRLSPEECGLKVGKELFTYAGPDFVSKLVGMGFNVFLDLKFHDIPATVAKAVRAAASLGVWMVNVHASGGEKMMMEARSALEELESPPLLIAVTVLTSSTQKELEDINIHTPLKDQVLKLASMAKNCGLDGVVCSAEETQMLREKLGSDFLLVTPGIRPEKSDNDDQKRVVTPENAIQMGSDFLVIGRPVSKSPNPVESLRTINEAISYMPSINK